MNKEWLQTREVVERRCHRRITARCRAQLGSRPYNQVHAELWLPVFDKVRVGRLVIDGQLFEQTLPEDQQDEKERP